MRRNRYGQRISRDTRRDGDRRRVFGLVLAVVFTGILVLLPLWLAGELGVPLD